MQSPDPNSINGLETWTQTFQLTPEQVEWRRQQIQAKRVAVFGADRLAQDVDNLPTPEAIDQLTWQIERFCTGPGSHNGRGGIRYRSFQKDCQKDKDPSVNVHWNPAGTVGGFGADIEWDGAIGAIETFSYTRKWRRPKGSFVSLPFIVEEGLFVDRKTGQPMIRRSIWSPRWYNDNMYASKPANADEVRQVSELLSRHSYEANSGLETEKLPIYLEIGYGLDPEGLLSRRSFDNKTYIGIDKAIGSYGSEPEAYPEAVREQTEEFEDEKEVEKPGQHINFVLGEGEHLPLQERSVHEVFMANVLNADVPYNVKGDILKEVRRVLEDRGNLVVRVNWNQGLWPVSTLVELLRKSGFDVDRSVLSSDVEYARMDAQYGKPVRISAPDGYYLMAQPDV